jgi:hypothetical protein
LTQWIDAYQHGTLILNVKEEGLEARLIDLMREKTLRIIFSRSIIPISGEMVENWRKHRCAVRVSEFESIETALTLAE